VLRAGLDRLDHLAALRLRREHDDRDLRQVGHLLHRAQELDPVHLGHVPVEQDQAHVRVLLEALEGVQPVRCGHGLVTEHFEDLLDHLAHDGGVVDDQDLHLELPSSFTR
jgi:hypothetical protein